MNDISLHLLHFFCIFLEFAISSVRGTYWLFGKLQFLYYHSPIKVEYLGTFSDWFQLWNWFFHDNCLTFQTKNHVYSWVVHLRITHKPTTKIRFKWIYLIFFQLSELNVGESYRQRTSHCAAISALFNNSLLKINLLHIFGNLLWV